MLGQASPGENQNCVEKVTTCYNHTLKYTQYVTVYTNNAEEEQRENRIRVEHHSGLSSQN